MILNTLRLAELMKELEPECSRSEFEKLEFAIHLSGNIGWPMAVYFRLAALLEEREPKSH